MRISSLFAHRFMRIGMFGLLVLLLTACGSSSTSSSNGQDGSGGNIPTSPSAKATENGGNTPTATTGKVTVAMVAEAGGLDNDIIKDDEGGNFTNHPSVFSTARNGVVKLL